MYLYQFQLLQAVDKEKCLRHGIFPRADKSNRSLNVDPDLPGYEHGEVLRCRKKIVRELGLSREAYVSQNHGNIVLRADSGGVIGHGDGIMTNRAGLGLMIKVADCQPVLFFAPKQKVAAAVHCGWRGALRGILQNTMLAFRTVYSVEANDLFVGIGPSLGPCCAKFSSPYQEFPESLHEFIMTNNKVDLWRMSSTMLVACGIPKEQIEIAKICTACNNDTWFSFRGDASDQQGRFAAVIGLV